MTDELIYERRITSILKEASSRKESEFEVYASGESMGPFIKEGDILVIKPATPKEIRLGDIPVFDIGGRLCAHRLVIKYFKGNRHIFVTKSDKTFVADESFTEQELLGKVVAIKRNTLLIDLLSPLRIFVNRFWGLLHLWLLYARHILKGRI